MASLALPWMMGVSSPGKSYLSSSSRTSISTSSSSSASSTMSHLFMKTMMYGTPTWRASRMCSRVCGMGPSAAEHDQDGAVHLRRAGDHVLDVVGVPGAVDVRVVAVAGLVLDVRGVDGDAARLFFRRRVDLVVGLGLAAELGRQHRRDRRRQRRLAMVHVPNRPHVHVRLGPLEFAFCHFNISVSKERCQWWFKVSARRRCFSAATGKTSHGKARAKSPLASLLAFAR